MVVTGQPLDVSRCPAAQIKPLHRLAVVIFCRLDGALRLLLHLERLLALSSHTYSSSPTRYIGPTITG